MLTSFSYIMIGNTADTEYFLIDPDAEVGTLLYCFWKETYVIGYVEYYGGMFTIVINMDDFDSNIFVFVYTIERKRSKHRITFCIKATIQKP